MSSIIEKLRGFDGTDGYWRYYYGDEPSVAIAEDIDAILYTSGKKVDSNFEEGGRWSNYERTVYEVREGDEVAYFEEVREVPGSESQDGMDLSYEFNEVFPHVVTTTIYKHTPQEEAI